MGYQESIIPVKDFSEVLGIDRAIRESEEVQKLEYLICYCGARARRSLFGGGYFGRSLSDIGPDERPFIKEGELFAVVGGARLYQGGPCIWLDCITGIDEEGYRSFFEDIELKELSELYDADSDLAKEAERKMRQHLKDAYEFCMR